MHHVTIVMIPTGAGTPPYLGGGGSGGTHSPGAPPNGPHPLLFASFADHLNPYQNPMSKSNSFLKLSEFYRMYILRRELCKIVFYHKFLASILYAE